MPEHSSAQEHLAAQVAHEHLPEGLPQEILLGLAGGPAPAREVGARRREGPAFEHVARPVGDRPALEVHRRRQRLHLGSFGKLQHHRLLVA